MKKLKKLNNPNITGTKPDVSDTKLQLEENQNNSNFSSNYEYKGFRINPVTDNAGYFVSFGRHIVTDTMTEEECKTLDRDWET